MVISKKTLSKCSRLSRRTFIGPHKTVEESQQLTMESLELETVMRNPQEIDR